MTIQLLLLVYNMTLLLSKTSTLLGNNLTTPSMSPKITQIGVQMTTNIPDGIITTNLVMLFFVSPHILSLEKLNVIISSLLLIFGVGRKKVETFLHLMISLLLMQMIPSVNTVLVLTSSSKLNYQKEVLISNQEKIQFLLTKKTNQLPLKTYSLVKLSKKTIIIFTQSYPASHTKTQQTLDQLLQNLIIYQTSTHKP